MKRLMAAVLCAAMLLGLSGARIYAEDSTLSAGIDGELDGETARFAIKLQNHGKTDETASVLKAYRDAAGIVQKTKTEKVKVKAGEKIVKEFEADASGVIYVWDGQQRPLCDKLSAEELEEAAESEKIDIYKGAWASAEPESENGAEKITDSDLSTKWTAAGVNEDNPQSATVYLGGLYAMEKISLAFGYGHERDYVFSVSLSRDGVEFFEAIPKTTSKRTDALQGFALPCMEARFARITMYGRKDSLDNGWVQLSEVELYGREKEAGGEELFSDTFSDIDSWEISPMDEMTYTDYLPALGSKLYAEAAENPVGADSMRLYDEADRASDTEGERLAVKNVTASQTPEAANPPQAVSDENLSTKWTASGVTDASPATLTLELDKTYYVKSALLAFGVANERTYVFSLELSEDGRNYTEVLNRKSSERTLETQVFSFAQTRARFARFTFYKRTDNSDNGWIQVTEAALLGGENETPGAGGILAQRRFEPPSGRADYEIDFSLYIPSKIAGTDAASYFSGISLTDGVITGGADLSHYAAFQLRFADEDGRLKINQITSNYFNEGEQKPLFDNTFEKDSTLEFRIHVSPKARRAYVTVSDENATETRTVGFAYSDDELTRSSHWTYLEPNTLIVNTGAGAKSEMYVSDLIVRESEEFFARGESADAVNGIVRFEAMRLSGDPTSDGAYYGRYIYHDGRDGLLKVKADVDPAKTRFVERPGLIGTGVSFEAVSEPGYFIVAESDGIYLKKLEENGAYCAKATFIKRETENLGYYTGSAYSYETYTRGGKYLYDTTGDKKSGDLRPWSIYEPRYAAFYQRSEINPVVSDNFYGTTISSQWWKNFPWNTNANPTNDTFNFSALVAARNVIVENGELFLKAAKATGWPTDKDGETGTDYNGSHGKGWERWKGYVGVVSIRDKVYNRQCYIEGSFKQPDSPIGYWNAFWLAGRDSWPPEIDIFEFLSSQYGKFSWNTTIHGEGDKNNIFGKQSAGIDLTNGYHTFALDWGYDYVKLYIDGRLFARGHNSPTINFQKNMRLILNTGIGGWEAEPDDTMVWDDGMRVKYIRTYQY